MAWIGLHDAGNNDTFVWIGTNDVLPDDSEVWYPGHPDHRSSVDPWDCAIMDTTPWWYTNPCPRILLFICEAFTEKL